MCRHQRINKCGAQQFHSQTGLILFCMFQLIFNSKKWNCILIKLLKSCMCLYFTQEAWRHVTWLKCGVVQPIINETVPAPGCWKCWDALFTPSSSINCWITVFEPKVWISVECYQYLLLSEAFASVIFRGNWGVFCQLAKYDLHKCPEGREQAQCAPLQWHACQAQAANIVKYQTSWGYLLVCACTCVCVKEHNSTI